MIKIKIKIKIKFGFQKFEMIPAGRGPWEHSKTSMSTRYLRDPYYYMRGWVYRVLSRLAGEYLGDGLVSLSVRGSWITWISIEYMLFYEDWVLFLGEYS
jgi:hypothetical protein